MSSTNRWIQDVGFLEGRRFIVVSNRQPFTHVRQEDGEIRVEKPPSGLTLALEPIVQATRGTWIAAASSDTDVEFTDERGHVTSRPPGVEYDLRRLFLPTRLTEDYYTGFANSTLWPLCHIAYHQPRFEERWWKAYLLANRVFCNAIVDEIGDDPAVVFIQDFHLAVLPLLLRERCPKALIAQFWHIPWPNPEAFRICPWRREILQGLLGNDLLGFHLAYHGRNFIETVDRELQVRVDHDSNTVFGATGATSIAAYPMSIDFERIYSAVQTSEAERQAEALHAHYAGDCRLVLSVERLDYTKGIVERLEAIERLFVRHPEWIERVVFVHVATPSRTTVNAYREYALAVEATIERINGNLSRPGWMPIRALHLYLEPEKVWNWYRAADAVVVSSLHDGMNLVAKEFVAAGRDDAVLVCSEFTGAARELREAVLINPYATDDFADALAMALGMPAIERAERMRRLRRRVSNRDIGIWAGEILRDIREHEFDANANHSPSMVTADGEPLRLARSAEPEHSRASGE